MWKYLDEVGIPYEVCSTQTSDAYRDDIITKGGKMQVPFLVDTNNGTQMYESGDIIEYVTNTYAGKTEKS